MDRLRFEMKIKVSLHRYLKEDYKILDSYATLKVNKKG